MVSGQPAEPAYLWYCGWVAEPADFIAFVNSVPSMKPAPNKGSKSAANKNFMECVFSYDDWRERAPKSKSASKFAPPPLRVLERSTSTELGGVSDLVMDGVMFPTRAIDYLSERQVDDKHPQAARIKTASDRDKAFLEDFKKYIFEKEKVSVDMSKFYFSYRKDIHPKDDPYVDVNF